MSAGLYRPELSFDVWTQMLPPLSSDPLIDLFVIPYAGGSGPVAFEHWPSLLPVRPGRYCSPCHRMPPNSSNEGSTACR